MLIQIMFVAIRSMAVKIFAINNIYVTYNEPLSTVFINCEPKSITAIHMHGDAMG